MFMIGFIAALCTSLVLHPSIARDTAAGPLYIDHVSVRTMLDDELHRDWAVIVIDDRITWIGPRTAARVPRGARRIDGENGVLMPGLIESHAHVDSATLRLYLPLGITTVRDMNGAPDHVAWRDAIAGGALVGPRLIVGSPLLAGVPQRWRHVLLTTPGAADSAADAAKRAGYDFLKIYDGLNPDVYEELTARARAIGLPVAGHLPPEVGAARAAVAHQRTIEHANQIVELAGGRQADSGRIAAVIDTLGRSGACITPTIASLEALSHSRSAWYDSVLATAPMRYADPGDMEWWRSMASKPGSTGHAGVAGAMSPFYQRVQLVAREVDRQRVPMLVGTDSPNPLMVPAFAFHEELRALQAAGIVTAHLLRDATRTAGECLAPGSHLGELRVNAPADLLLVSGDPMQDLQVLRAPRGVMARGHWFSSFQLQHLLQR